MIESPKNPENTAEFPEVTPEVSETPSQEPEGSREESQTPQPAVETAAEAAMAALLQEVESLKQQLAEREPEIETWKNRYLTLAAEFDNFRKRTAKEKEDLQEQIKGRTLEQLLPVVDNFERARTQIKPETDGEMGIHKSYQGVYKIFVDSLKRLGVSAMRPEGEPFDPAYHEAMLREATDEYEEGTVIEQLIRGYMLGERVLRHAMVKVAAPQETVIPSEGNESSPPQENSSPSS